MDSFRGAAAGHCRVRQQGQQDHYSKGDWLTGQTLRFILVNAVLKPEIEMEKETAIDTPTQLPFEVDAAVLEKVAEFRSQQQESLKLDGPPSVGGETKIDF